MTRKKKTIFIIISVCIGIWLSIGVTLYRLDMNKLNGNSDFVETGLHRRFFIFKHNMSFDAKITPIDNMKMVLQSLDSFGLCEEDWLKDMQYVVLVLKEQYSIHKNSLDPGVQELMALQLLLIEKMDGLIKDSDASRVIALEEAFEAYMKYYEEEIIRRGSLNEMGGEV